MISDRESIYVFILVASLIFMIHIQAVYSWPAVLMWDHVDYPYENYRVYRVNELGSVLIWQGDINECDIPKDRLNVNSYYVVVAVSNGSESEPSPPVFWAFPDAGDVDGSGKIDVKDLVLLAGKLAGNLKLPN